MAFTLGANDGALNGTTAVTVVAAPGAGVVRTAQTIFIYNADTAAVTVTVQLDNDGTDRILVKVTLAVGDTLRIDGPLVLDATTKKIEAVMSAAAAATNPAFYSCYGDV